MIYPVDRAIQRLNNRGQMSTPMPMVNTQVNQAVLKELFLNQTKRSVNMILNGLKDLEALVKEHNPSFAIALYSCLTVQVENLHAVGHFKDQFPFAVRTESGKYRIRKH